MGIPPSIELTSHQASVAVAPVLLLAALLVDVGQQGEAVTAQMAAVGQGEAGETLDHVNLRKMLLGIRFHDLLISFDQQMTNKYVSYINMNISTNIVIIITIIITIVIIIIIK